MKPKILIIIPTLALGGGAERVAATLTEKLSYKYHFYILTFYDSSQIYSHKGEYLCLEEDQTSLTKLLIPFKLHRVISKLSPDLIISFMDHTNMVAIITKMMFRFKIPLILSVRINPMRAYSETRKYYNMLIKIFYKLNSVNKIITNANEIQSILENEYGVPKEKVITIPNAVDIGRIKEYSADNCNDNNHLFKNTNLTIFVNVGRLAESKNHKFLINAFSHVYNMNNKARLAIIGDGPLRHYLKDYITKQGLDEVIILLGLKKNPFCYLQHSDVFVLSSKYEGMPNVILEAMACNLPIISTNIPGAREILQNGEYGILVKSEDVDALSNKMLLLMKNEEIRKNLREKSIKRIRDFDYNKIIERWDFEISKLLN